MSRYFAFFALLALAVAYPASEDFPRPITTITESDFEDSSPWFRFPPFGNIFAPLTKLFSSFADIGPRIEVDEDKFRVIVNVKDYKKEDLKVKVKGDFILVQGAHEAKHDDHDLFASQFFHTYTLPINASAADVTASLSSDGYLEVTAPINGADENNKVVDREVPIVEVAKPFIEEKIPVPSVTSDDKVESTDNVEAVDKVENVDKIESLDTPVAPIAQVDNGDKVEPLDTPVAPLAQVDNVDKVESLDIPEEPLAKVENVDKIENVDKDQEVPQVTTEIASEPEDSKKEVTTSAPEREDVTVAVEDIKVPQDNELNEIQP